MKRTIYNFYGKAKENCQFTDHLQTLPSLLSLFCGYTNLAVYQILKRLEANVEAPNFAHNYCSMNLFKLQIIAERMINIC